ncbi:MAG: hypothetical protein R2941_24790 [Desulfobacterales bacterium]
MHSHTLIIRHVSSEPDRFLLFRPRDGHSAPQPVEIRSPDTFPVEGRPNSSLTADLRWYLERFLDYPFHQDTALADRVLDSLKAWGEQAFTALFGDRDGSLMLHDAIRNGYSPLHLQISGDDPRILAWPWGLM